MNDEKTNVMPGSDIDELRAYFPWENWGECFWGFTCFSRQNYADVVPLDAVDEIMLGVQCEGGLLVRAGNLLAYGCRLPSSPLGSV